MGKRKQAGRSAAHRTSAKVQHELTATAADPKQNPSEDRTDSTARSLGLVFVKSLVFTAVLCTAVLSAFEVGSASHDSPPPPESGD